MYCTDKSTLWENTTKLILNCFNNENVKYRRQYATAVFLSNCEEIIYIHAVEFHLPEKTAFTGSVTVNLNENLHSPSMVEEIITQIKQAGRRFDLRT